MEETIFSGTQEMEDFFRSLSITYLCRSEQLVDLNPSHHYEHSAYYRNNREEFLRLSETYGSLIINSIIVPSSIRFIDGNVGRGLFSEEFRSPDDFVGEYAGVIQKASRCRPVRDELGGFATDYSWTYPERKGFRSLEVNGRTRGNETRFVNHSFSPNCRMEHALVGGRWVLFLVTNRAVSVGEQFTVDYGEEYWTGGHRELIMI